MFILILFFIISFLFFRIAFSYIIVALICFFVNSSIFLLCRFLRKIVHFIDNLKSITDSLKSITAAMEEFNPLENNKINETQFILFYFLFGSRFFGTSSSELIEDVSLPELSESDSDSSEPEL